MDSRKRLGVVKFTEQLLREAMTSLRLESPLVILDPKPFKSRDDKSKIDPRQNRKKLPGKRIVRSSK